VAHPVYRRIATRAATDQTGALPMTPIVQATAIAVVTLGTGAATVSVMNGDIPDMAVPEAAWSPGHELDGRTFSIEATLDNGQTDVDELRFADGGFISMGCEEYCDFGYSDYQTWGDADGVIHFTATADCPTAPHRTVWHGQVAGDAITVEMSWTTRRWYWTHQINGVGGGPEITDSAVSG
jgi:hypothetical protein